jgi:amino acid transporter
MSITQLLFGKPLATEEGEGERVGPLAGVAILGLDALASACYGPEALLTVLRPAGTWGLRYMPLITAVIIGLLTLVFLSYRQTLAAYPSGGGAYTIAKENLGTPAALFAAAALALDYLLNAAVAISAGVGALCSAVPRLLPHTLALCLLLLLLLTLVNLRGVRATGLLFTLPTFVFVGCLLALLAVGVFKLQQAEGLPQPQSLPSQAGVNQLSWWVLLRAFANGCTAMTGVEAVSNGVPIFREPRVVGARRTLTLIILILAVLLVGITFLCVGFDITATQPGQAGYESVISRVAAATVGRGALYHLTLASVITVLSLSANTSFAAFPALCRFLAADRFLPEAFQHRGRRLSLSFGIVILAGLAACLLIAFGGVTDALIPLFAVGALLAFTMSQAGMVAHWRKQPGAHARKAMWLNAVGALATGATLLVVLSSKLAEGAWLTVLLVGGMIVTFRRVRRHYGFVARVTHTDASLEVGLPHPPIAVVPLRRWDAISLKALRFASGFAARVVAVQVLTGEEGEEDLTPRWRALAIEPARLRGLRPPELEVLASPYRQLMEPLLDYVLKLGHQNPERQIAVVIPELVEPRWYHYLLHSHAAALLKALLRLRGGPQVVIVSTPWYLKDWLPERRTLSQRTGFFHRWRARRRQGQAST